MEVNKMNKNNNLVLFASISLFIAMSVQSVKGAGSGSGSALDGLTLTEVTASSAVVVNGPTRVVKVWLATTTAADFGHYAVLVDSAALVTQNGSSIDSVTRSRVRTPPLLFPTTSSLVGKNDGNLVFDASPYGVFFSSAVTLWKSADSSGKALRAYILWQK